MRSDFPTASLAEIADDVSYGYTAKAANEPVGPKFLRITDIVPDLIDWADVPYCTISRAERDKYLVRDGDIVIARTGATVGYAKLLRHPPEAVFASYLVRVRVAEGNDARYVGLVVTSDAYKRFILANAGGAAQPNANAKVLTSFPVPLPPLGTQRKIASVLLAYDDLIGHHRRRIQVLDEMASAIYREWFIHFRYPGHEGVPLVDSKLGPIPKGWLARTWGDLVSLDYGRALSGYKNAKADYPVFGTNGPIGWHNEPLFPPGVVIGRKGAYRGIHFSDQPCWVIDTAFFLNIRDTKQIDPLFAYYQLRMVDLNSIDSGSAIPSTSRDAFYAIPAVIPPVDIVHRFSDMARDMYELKRTLEASSGALRATRDLLLSPLISGEIEVSELDIALGDAVA